MGIDTARLKSRVESEIIDQSILAKLQDKLKQIEGVEQLAIEFGVTEADGQKSTVTPVAAGNGNGHGTVAAINEQPYKNMAQRGACMAVLRHAGRPMSAAEVAEVLANGGYPFTAENRTNAVYAALNAMAHKGQVGVSRHGTFTKFEYRARDENVETSEERVSA